MLDGYFLPGRGEVEHVEDDRFVTSVLAAMDGTDHLYQRLAFVKCLLRAVLAYDRQVALLHDAVVHYAVMMPTRLGSDGKIQTYHAQFGLSLRKIRQPRSVPTPRRPYQFCCLNGHMLFFACAPIWRKVTINISNIQDFMQKNSLCLHFALSK